MERIDLIYRAFAEYRKFTREDKDCARQRKAITRADIDSDSIEVTTAECEIDDDWIDAIEVGLDFIGRAIAEERQFILSNGEVIPIEKVKTVSKESVEHLAKHSNLLTKEPEEGEDFIPDKLYTVERLTDYAVYENRFLYMLLCYLKEFISVRYDAIMESTTTYSGKMQIKKSFHAGKRFFTYEVKLDEKMRNDQFLRDNNPSREKINKIDGLLKGVVSFLAHPLMVEVAKAPRLKPPITETNVLKMNRNFNNAVKLYYFVTSYDKKGYTITQKVNKLSPFKEEIADEFAEAAELNSFLTYEHGMGIENVLKENFEVQLKLEKEEEERKKAEQIKKLRKQIEESGGDIEEYLLLLESRNKSLETDSLRLIAARSRISELERKSEQQDLEITTKNNKITELSENVEAAKQEIKRREEKHAEELALQSKKHIGEMLEQKDRFEKEKTAQRQELQNSFFEEKQKIREEHSKELEELHKKQADEIALREGEIAEVKNQCAQGERLLEEEKVKLQNETELRYLTQAKLNALKQKTGEFEGNEDYNSREGFDELERQYNHFKRLYEAEWKKTKKKIRKDYLKITLPPKKTKESEKDESGEAENPENLVSINNNDETPRPEIELAAPVEQSETQSEPIEAGVPETEENINKQTK